MEAPVADTPEMRQARAEILAAMENAGLDTNDRGRATINEIFDKTTRMFLGVHPGAWQVDCIRNFVLAVARELAETATTMHEDSSSNYPKVSRSEIINASGEAMRANLVECCRVMREAGYEICQPRMRIDGVEEHIGLIMCGTYLNDLETGAYPP